MAPTGGGSRTASINLLVWSPCVLGDPRGTGSFRDARTGIDQGSGAGRGSERVVHGPAPVVALPRSQLQLGGGGLLLLLLGFTPRFTPQFTPRPRVAGSKLRASLASKKGNEGNPRHVITHARMHVRFLCLAFPRRGPLHFAMPPDYRGHRHLADKKADSMDACCGAGRGAPAGRGRSLACRPARLSGYRRRRRAFIVGPGDVIVPQIAANTRLDYDSFPSTITAARCQSPLSRCSTRGCGDAYSAAVSVAGYGGAATRSPWKRGRCRCGMV